MARHIQAYFRNEDGAEGARTSLIGYAAEQVEVGRLENNLGRDTKFLLPIVPLGNNSGMYAGGAPNAAGVPGSTVNPGVPLAVPERGAANGDTDVPDSDASERPASEKSSELLPTLLGDEDYDKLQYVLSAKVSEADYNAVVNKLRSAGGYVEVLD
ncbi:hypothetical protein DCC85_16750 [Paenibacillus sp. CAA11]|uniref:hypothetical protein n=1 Tax=Paenibacillus sp. CAA11 TaxID=1532905 RepID=UPI000D3CEB81|nr:hypothetical protein [Paenibacillus sp. CAA11]AWB45686.1 hypothetical protein DCC85_16750 [Paenibacillus sp. CAA11]